MSIVREECRPLVLWALGKLFFSFRVLDKLPSVGKPMHVFKMVWGQQQIQDPSEKYSRSNIRIKTICKSKKIFLLYPRRCQSQMWGCVDCLCKLVIIEGFNPMKDFALLTTLSGQQNSSQHLGRQDQNQHQLFQWSMFRHMRNLTVSSCSQCTYTVPKA